MAVRNFIIEPISALVPREMSSRSDWAREEKRLSKWSFRLIAKASREGNRSEIHSEYMQCSC